MEYLTVGFTPLAEPVGDADQIMDLGELPENAFRGVASVFGGIVDAWMPTIIHRGAFTKTLQEQSRGIPILWQHNPDEPIGKPTKLFEGEEGLVVQAQISRTVRGRDALTLLRDGVVDAMSIGFDAIKEDIERDAAGNPLLRNIRELRLWEISVVTWGADQNARILEVNSDPRASLVRKFGINPGKLETMAVIRFQNLPLADRDCAWDRQAVKTRVRVWADAEEAPNAKFGRCWVWRDPSGESFEDWKLLVADVVDGTLTAVPRAIFAAAAAVQGARGGLDVPKEDIPGIKAHLDKYYAKMRDEFDDETIVSPWSTEQQNYSLYTREDALCMIGHALTQGMDAASAVEALAALTEVESPESTHLADVADLDLQLMNVELAMMETLSAEHPA